MAPQARNKSAVLRRATVASEQTLAVLNRLIEPVWIFDYGRMQLWWANPAALELWDAPDVGALRARDVGDMSKATRTRLADCQARIERGEVVYEQWTLYPNGEPKTVLATCTRIEVDDGRIAILLEGRLPGEGVNDPAMLRGVEALHHTRVLIETLTESAQIIYQNTAALGAFGSAQGRGFLERFTNENDAEKVRRLLQSPEPQTGEYHVRTTDGERWHSVDWHPIRDPVTGERLLLVQQQDITERKQMRDALTVATANARSASRLKSEFIATMSHEIRTPMNGVLGMLQLLNGSEGLTATQQEWVRAAHDSAKALLTIIGDILDASKLDARQIELAKHDFELPALVRGVVDLWAPHAEGIAVRWHISPEVTPRRRADANRLRQVLLNLVSNAVKFTDAGHVEVRVSLAERGEPWVRFEVEDSGIGIPPDQRNRLFEAFVQADTSISRRFGGTGLGLAISQQLVGLMGGTISLESPLAELGRGSRFSFEVSLEPYGEGVSEAKDHRSDTHATAGRSLRILIAEDNRINQRVIDAMVKQLGHSTVIANDGDEAVSMVKEHEDFDLIFMDLQMPNVDGFTATRAIRALGAHRPTLRTLPIVAITANAGTTDRRRCADVGMTDFLAKPILLSALSEVIDRVIEPLANA